MECPECGNEIPEGKLYCPTCGYAVQIVPDYDADLEENLSSVGSDIAGNVNRIDKAESAGEEFDDEPSTKEIPVIRKDEISDLMRRNLRDEEERQKLMVYAGAGVFFIILVIVSMVASKSLGNMSFIPENAVDEAISGGSGLSAMEGNIELPTEEQPSEADGADDTSEVSGDEAAEDEIIKELVVYPEAGSYTRPQGISAKVAVESGADGMMQEDEEGIIYFTRDGTEPDEKSEVFKKELAMPLGHSKFAFRFSDGEGKLSDTVRVEYDLQYTGVCSSTDAANLIIATLIKDGALLDIYGHVAGSLGAYTYQCNSMISSGGRDYYLIPESYEEPGQSKKRTGKIYAVDAENLSMFTVNQDSSGRYSFEMFF
ncbi:MAG: chitobiase/beta-hexosaminidase C-terminal domain-containing protein [Lachnospiraceae bacterium]|nr:chitobiase/beta-hexosaminidase C-terminal domain-containing protein [Lachnospiraceae bacterium]